MLRYEARLALTQQVTALAIGVAAPLLIALYTIFRPWSPLHAMDNLLEAALLLAGWGTLFGILHLCTGWLRPRQQEREAEQRHLPLTSIHFFVRRLLHSSGVLLCSATFSLLCWAALLIYYGRPYLANTDWEENWAYGPRGEADMHWWPMMLCIAAVILGSTLLPVALGVWLEALTTRSELRCLLMLGLPVGAWYLGRAACGWYAAKTFVGYSRAVTSGLLALNYQQTQGAHAQPYIWLLVVIALLPVGYGWLRPWARWGLLILPLLAVGCFVLRRALPEQWREAIRPYSSAVFSHDARMACALFTGHLSPPLDIRLLMWSYPSNILFARKMQGIEPVAPVQPKLPPEPEYPEDAVSPVTGEYSSNSPRMKAWRMADDAWLKQTAPQREHYEKADAAYRKAYSAYEAQQKDWFKLPLWVGAGLYPLLLPLWAMLGLLLGQALRGGAKAEG